MNNQTIQEKVAVKNKIALNKSCFGAGARISFIIVNYRFRNYLEKFLASLREKFFDIESEIIVVNNDEGDLELNNLQIKIINLEKNYGFGKANNIGAKVATGEYFFFLNPDTIILSGDINKILTEFENDQKIGIIGPRLVGENNKTQKWIAGLEINLWDIIRNNLGFPQSRKIWESSKTIECDWVSGAAMFIRKDLFDKLEGFDEKFFMYFEDVDLCRRAKDFGYKIIYYPEFIIKHFGGKSFSSKLKQKKLYYFSLIRYLKKNF